MKPSLEESIIEVWRQALVEDANVIQLAWIIHDFASKKRKGALKD
jgi:hypothetical protein